MLGSVEEHRPSFAFSSFVFSLCCVSTCCSKSREKKKREFVFVLFFSSKIRNNVLDEDMITKVEGTDKPEIFCFSATAPSS